MANEIQYDHTNNTDYLYALVRNLTGQVLRLSDFKFVDYPASGSLEDYAINRGTPDNGFLWRCDFPAISAGSYIIQIKKTTGLLAEYGDITLGTGQGYWNSSSISDTTSTTGEVKIKVGHSTISFESGLIDNPATDDGEVIQTGYYDGSFLINDGEDINTGVM